MITAMNRLDDQPEASTNLAGQTCRHIFAGAYRSLGDARASHCDDVGDGEAFRCLGDARASHCDDVGDGEAFRCLGDAR